MPRCPPCGNTTTDAASGVGSIESRVDQASVTLIDELYALYLEHEHCGELDSAVQDDRVRMACTCGAVINRCADDD